MKRFIAIGVATLLSSAAMAQSVPFNKPASTQTVKPKSDTDPLGQLRCTVYPDFMIRETGTDTPGPGKASLVPKATTCDGSNNGKVLDTESFTFAGRKGNYLVFSATDPNGAVPFKILDTSGKALYTDSMTGEFRTVELENGLHLRFTRAVNSTCSVLKDSACWSKMGASGLLPHVVTAGKPPTETCSASYRRGKVTPDDPSMITYDVDMTIDPAGKAQVKSRGMPGCEPMP